MNSVRKHGKDIGCGSDNDGRLNPNQIETELNQWIEKEVEIERLLEQPTDQSIVR